MDGRTDGQIGENLLYDLWLQFNKNSNIEWELFDGLVGGGDVHTFSSPEAGSGGWVSSVGATLRTATKILINAFLLMNLKQNIVKWSKRCTKFPSTCCKVLIGENSVF